MAVFWLACLVLIPQTASAAPCDTKPGAPPFIRHDTSLSYCELCGYGYVTVVVTNPYSYTFDTTPPPPFDPPIPGATMTNLVVEENLLASGLTYYAPPAPAPGVTYRVNGGPPVNGFAPLIGGGGSILTFGPAQIPALASLASREEMTLFNTISITFPVMRLSDPEGLTTANRTIQATLTFGTDSGCGDSPQTDTDVLNLREPIPNIIKTGWNHDAGQRQGTASDPVYGTNNDDVVWRVRIDNVGSAGLQDLRFDDIMQTDSLVINYACATEGAANTIAANDGAGPAAGCAPYTNNINDFIVTNPYGDMALSFDGYEVDVTAGGAASIYLVGKIISSGSCTTSRTNTVNDVQWGCEAQIPADPGGISQTSSGIVPGDVATLYSRYNDDHPVLSVERRLTGTNTSQPVGTKGTMTITIRNNSGGSVKNIHLADVLPPEYVMDRTFTPEIDVTPAYGMTYDGLVNTLVWTNENTTDPLANTAPEFDLTSGGVTHPLYPDQVNMLRQGDVAVVRFRVVLIESDYYDRNANLDVNPEEYPVTGTDPTYQTPLSNTLTVDFDLFCASQGHQQFVLTGNGTGNPAGSAIPAFPEDLDIAVGGAVFILTNDPAQLLTLPIELTNHGGHDAADYHVFVSFGTTMEIVNAPSGCTPISLNGATHQPDPWKVWLGDPADPLPIPSTATVYSCTSPAVVAPGQTVTYNFDVRKSGDPARILADDLSLRADVVGEIVLSDGTTLLDFPAPIVRPDGELDRANNYSLDTTWARVIGFNLKKTQVGTCNENNPPSFDANGFEEIQIGEECTFHIETGGWFGFKTPGFAYIAVQNIDVVDEVPDGQVYISSADAGSTGLIQGVTLTLPGTPITEGQFDWRFNVPDSQQIKVADEWFVVDTTTRLLNKAIDQRLAPNLHAANSHNVLTSDFDATFMNNNTGLVEMYTLGPSTVGYPNEAIRRVDLTVTEPYISVVKEVCNESLYGSGLSCSNFVPVADDGDAYNNYIYRLTLTNEASSGGVQRAPAYDVIVTDQLDGSDLAYVFPFASDGLDNDGDGLSGGSDSGGEGTISDNTVKNGTPAVVTFSYTHSSALQRIDPGQTVQLFYRVDYDDDAAPLQTFTNTVTATYDSLTGEFGSQSVPQRPNSVLGGARFYTSDPAAASVRIIPVETRPKSILNLSNTPLLGVPGTQGVTIGEEIEYQLNTLLPVALLRSFVIRDELPAGLRCSEAPVINLNAAPYSAAGFQPGGIITPTCSDDLVEWNFGDQRVTQGTLGNRYDFAIQFIAQVENNDLTNDGDTLSNGNPATVATAEYFDETGTLVTYNFGQVDVLVQEPLIDLTKAFNPVEADARDVLTVTVTATNSGTATAYNLQVLDDLDGSNLTYVGNVGGSNPPDNVDTTTLGSNRPIFSWNVPNGIDVGSTISFTFEVRIADNVQPHQVMSNTIQAVWTSLPGQATVLNSSGSIGADGTVTGVRNGALPNAGDPVNDYETAAASQMTIAAPVLTKTDLEPATVPTIGAHRRFRIEVALPEGITDGVIITDNLDAAGLSYVLANNAAFDISYSFVGIASINGQPPAEAVFNSVPADGSSGSVTWDIGTVVTQTEDDSNTPHTIDPVIRIDYYARVNNDLVTDAGDTLLNGAVFNYLNGETGVQETQNATAPSVIVSEPDLTLTKTVENATNPGVPPVAGDILEYRLTAINTGSSNSTAFDVNLVDTLPTGLILDSGFTPTATINAVAVPGFVGIPSGAPAGPLTWGRDNGDGSLDIPAGQTLVIIYRTLVQVVADPAGLIENGVFSDWTSLEDVNTFERTGEGCPTITPPNDYCVGPVFATTTGVAPEMVFQKTVINETTGADPGVTASPGDVLRYRLVVTNISTASGVFNLTDELDQLNATPLFVPGTLTIVSSPTGGTNNSDPYGGAAGTGLVSFTGLSLDGGDSLAIEFTVQLVPVIPSGTLVLNQGSLLLIDLGTVLSDDPNLGGDDNPTQTLIVSSPDWLIEKTVQDITDASTILFAGDVLRYTITIKNIGTENALNVALRDPVPADTTYVAGSTTLNGAAVADPSPGVSSLIAGIPVNAPEDPTPGAMRADPSANADNLATVTFDVQVNAGTASGTPISNQGFVGGSGTASGVFPEQPSDDPATAAADDPTVIVVSSVEFRKTAFNETTGGSGATATPGDTLRYRLEITNTSTATLDGLSIVDNLENLQASEARYFVPGTLTLVVVPPGADATNTDPNGGSKGTGIVDIRDLSVASGDTLTVEFTVQLAPVITNGTQVLNQADLIATGAVFLRSDDADPALTGDEDPTPTLITSGPDFEVLKTSTILSGDPTVLMAGETLRYTITIKNIGTENAVDVVLRDFTPANTTYVANSTTLNGVAVTDPGPGINPLESGIPVSAPENTTPGYLRADASPTATNVATVTFDVVVDPAAMDGLIIENQGFVSGNGAASGAFPEQPSDDPATPAVDDPTRNVVGNMPLLYAHKTVGLFTDNNSNGFVDPGDVLRYSIVITNSGAVQATNVVLTDSVPNDTTYVAGSLLLNGTSTGAGATLPLIAGLPVNSADNPGPGIVSPGASATVTFEVVVNAAVPTGTLISNQGDITSAELEPGLTDADGVPSNGFQPTVIAVGDVQLLAITKEVTVVGGGSAEPGSELAYLIRVTNIGSLPATLVTVSDDLNPPLGSLVSYVAGSGTMNGTTTGVTFAANVLTADYSGVYGDLQPGGTIAVRFRVVIDPSLPLGTTITNTGVVRWNSPQDTATADVSLDVGGTPGSAALNGSVWHDVNFDTVFDSGSEASQEGWLVELYLNGLQISTVQTDANGAYRFSGLLPTSSASGLYEIRFHAPGAGATTPSLGYADSPFTDGPQLISGISVAAGNNLQDLNLPLWPNGTVYNSVARTPIAGATLTMLNATTGSVLPGQCFDDPVQQNQVTTANGFYKFDLNFSTSACPAGGSYLIQVAPPVSGYLNTPSIIIPPSSDAGTAPFSVPACPGSAFDAVPLTSEFCEVVTSSAAPPLSVAAGSAGTNYHLHLTLDNGMVPGQSQIFNNPLPIDPVLNGAVAITKTAAFANVTKGTMVPYTITLTNIYGVPLEDIRIVDRFPAGFKYVAGSARLDGTAVEPQTNGRELVWDELELEVNRVMTIKLLLMVSSGVSEGEYVNRAQVFNTTLGTAASGEASATVHVIPDPDFDCTDVIGKVFDDRNLNGQQDRGEPGLSGVRVATARGLIATTDEHGRYHLTCVAVPDEDRGSNFIMKLDDRSLPSGYRVVTENPRVQRATRGKMMRFNFGATIHRVVSMDIADGVFEPATTRLRLQWQSKIDQLLKVLKDSPSLLRLSYLADVEDEGLVNSRLKALKSQISRRWKRGGNGYRLTVETEVFWRRGGPPKK